MDAVMSLIKPVGFKDLQGHSFRFFRSKDMDAREPIGLFKPGLLLQSFFDSGKQILNFIGC